MTYPVALMGARLSSLFLPKMREAIRGRSGYQERWSSLQASLREASIWFHVASVGEFEQARPVITAIKRTHPHTPVIVTFSSPSGYHFWKKREKAEGGVIAFADYLPFDRARTMRFCLECARPRLLVFVKFDLWPNLIWEARARGIPVALIDATLSPSSKRLSKIGRWFYASLYRAIDPILAISDEDAARFSSARNGTAVAVCGDTRFDRVMERWNARARDVLALPDDGAITLIAGSTWPPDEARLLPALARLFREVPDLRVVIVPHEPTPVHIGPLRRWALENGLSVCTTSEKDAPTARVVLVDTVGVLAEAYAHANVAYVGGAFSTGVHSVIEPAIAGLPVVFGPRHDNSFEAGQLLERGAATSVGNDEETYLALARYLTNDAVRREAGAAANAYVSSQLGATEKCMAALSSYL